MAIKYKVIPIKVSCNHYINYSYVIIDSESGQAAVVDPAWEIEPILKVIDQNNASLTKILLTHSHFDHVNLVEFLVSRFHATVYMSKKEIDFYNFTCPNLVGILESETIRLGNTTISCLLTPGHTVGSVCYLLLDCIFTGDTLFSEGCGLCDTNGGNPEKMFESLQRIKTSLPHSTRIYPGHSFGKPPGSSLKVVIKDNIYLQFNDKKQFTKFRMRKNQTMNYNFQ